MQVEWRVEDGQLKPFLPDGTAVAWAAQPGAQELLLSAPYPTGERDGILEILIEGTRGGGKSDAIIMDFAQHVGQGFGEEWNGLIFRRTYPELKDIEGKAERWLRRIFPGIERAGHRWTWPTGEWLEFSYLNTLDDYWKHHGWSTPFLGFDELTSWPNEDIYLKMFSINRSSNPKVPRKIRACCNPKGVGHQWVKDRWRLPTAKGRLMGDVIANEDGLKRVAIHSTLSENKVLEHAEPDYRAKLRASTTSEAERRAWEEGDWDIIEGGRFTIRREVHSLPAFPLKMIPPGWLIDRAYDDGQAKPFSVGWYAESNGEPIVWEGRTYGAVRGDLIRIAEWYGWNGTPNKGLRMPTRSIALGILERETDWGIVGRVWPGPADTAIWNPSPRDPSQSVASDMQAQGVNWDQADKGPGSRTQGWRQIDRLLAGAYPDENGRREKPGLFVLDSCPQFWRTVPGAPMDPANPDDIDTDYEDHICDELRYRVRRAPGVEKPYTLHLY